MTITRGLTAAVFCAGVALCTAGPASAVVPPPDGTYTYVEPGSPPTRWTMSAVCVQAAGARQQSDYTDPVVQAQLCSLNTLSADGEAGVFRLVGGRWTFQTERREGLVCPDGSVAPSIEIYSFDDATLTGTHTSAHNAVCGMQPDLTKQPFTLTFVAPLNPPIERYPLRCYPNAVCT